jgi:hypothetical protein
MNRHASLIIAMALFSASVFAFSNQLTLELSVRDSDLPGSFDGVINQGFDISPDGKTIAVAFQVGEGDKGVGVWFALWEIANKRLLSKTRIDGGLTVDEARNPHSGREVRYSPNGEIIVVQSGPRVLMVQSKDLNRIKSIGPLPVEPSSKYGPAIWAFDISRDSHCLAVLTRSVGRTRAIAGVQVIDLTSGATTAQWSIQAAPSSIALSDDGSRVLLSDVRISDNQFADVALFEAKTGAVLRGFSSGCPNLDICGASDARFWGKDRIVTVPKAATDGRGQFIATALRIFDENTGLLIRELKPRRFSSTGAFTIANQAPLLATVNAWDTPSDVVSELNFRHARPEIWVFNLVDGTASTVRRHIPRGQQARHVDQYCLRVSGDASIVALFEDQIIKVYKLSGRTISGSGNSLPPSDLIPSFGTKLDMILAGWATLVCFRRDHYD